MFSSYKKIFLLGFIIVILIAIPLSVYMVQQRQRTEAEATPSTVLSLEPSSATVQAGNNVELGIYVNPGTNLVSFIKLSISFNSSNFTTVSDSLTANSIEVIEAAQYESGRATISLSIGSDPTKAISSKTKIATLKLKATNAVSPTNANITFDPAPDTQVLSIGSEDGTSENVLSNTIPATVTVTGSTVITTSTPTPTITGTSTSIPTPTSIQTTTTAGSPVCTSLTVDRSTSGYAPYAITFTANGSDSDGTISKVSFNFGEGTAQESTTGGGIGTSSISVPMSHSYANTGTYTAYAILTDNSGNSSSQQSSCTQTITVTSSSQGYSSGSTTTTYPGYSSGSTQAGYQSSGQAALPPTGPGENIVGIGIAGIVLTIIGTTLLILL